MKTDEVSITVSGVTFSASQVKTATVLIDGREITIGEKEEPKRCGFSLTPQYEQEPESDKVDE